MLLVPVFGLLEGAGVANAVLRPERGFRVIDKPVTQTAGATPTTS